MPRGRRNRWNLKKVNWNEYKIQTDLGFNNWKNMSYLKFIEIIERASEQSIPAGLGKINKYRTPIWWDYESQNLIQRRKFKHVRWKFFEPIGNNCEC